MTSKECLMILARLETTWHTRLDAAAKEVYGENLGELDYKICLAAVKMLTRTNKYLPVVSEILSAYNEILSPPELNDACAVELVNRLMQDFGRYRQAEGMEWLKTKDFSTYQVVKAIGYRNICDGDFNFIRPELVKMRKNASEDLRKNAMISERLRKEIGAFSEQLFLSNSQNY